MQFVDHDCPRGPKQASDFQTTTNEKCLKGLWGYQQDPFWRFQRARLDRLRDIPVPGNNRKLCFLADALQPYGLIRDQGFQRTDVE
ncbi:hypothetical protein GCM10011315_40250 [Roseovarius pacificus]|nr:hypothetical protein GCM10011315_40250 [Roseovarius pacificus]